MSSKEELTAWVKFIMALEQAQARARDDGYRRAFLEQYRSELVLLSFWLNELRVCGGESTRSVSPPEECDYCAVDLTGNGLFVDGQTSSGMWSFMCLTCFGEHGAGIGWGVGQLYRMIGKDAEGEPDWICIAGGNPEPEGDSSA